jgi:DNA-binding protein HU-beta
VNKQEFVDALSQQCDLSKAEAGRALDAILESLTETIADGEEVRFTGFGTFSSQRRRAREGVNPQDPSQKIRIRAAQVPKFKAGASLRAAVADAASDGAGTGGSAKAAPPTAASVPRAAARPGASENWVPLGLRQ